MPTVSALLAHSSVHLQLLAGSADGVAVNSVVTAESFDRIARAPAGSIVVVFESAATRAAAYELDVAIRHATDRHLGALVLVGRAALPVTSRSLADRAGLPILAAPAAADVADLVLRIDRIVRGGAADTLVRIEAALDAIQHADGASAEELVRRASEALSTPLRYKALPGTGASQDPGTVTLRGTPVGSVEVVAPATLDEACSVVLPALIAAVERELTAEFARRYAPVESRAELLAQLLVAERSQLPPLMTQARQLAFPTERTHIVITVRARDDDRDIGASRALLETVELAALQELPRSSDEWNIARPPGSLIIVRSVPRDGHQLRHETQRDVERVLGRIPAGHRSRLAVGMGAAHAGIEGLRHSAHEADSAAMSALGRGHFGVVAMFDATGIERIIADLATSPLSRRMFEEVWRPLETGGPARAARLIETLSAYLDMQSSPTAAAKLLHLHPNAVSYRVRQAVELLQRDLTDPDERIIVHLACRAWLLARRAAP